LDLRLLPTILAARQAMSPMRVKRENSHCGVTQMSVASSRRRHECQRAPGWSEPRISSRASRNSQRNSTASRVHVDPHRRKSPWRQQDEVRFAALVTSCRRGECFTRRGGVKRKTVEGGEAGERAFGSRGVYYERAVLSATHLLKASYRPLGRCRFSLSLYLRGLLELPTALLG
jgi:hypothetical protein